MAVLTVAVPGWVRNREDAIVRLFSKVYANQDWLPQGLGVGQPIIKPKGIDDVPIVTRPPFGRKTPRWVPLNSARWHMPSNPN